MNTKQLEVFFDLEKLLLKLSSCFKKFMEMIQCQDLGCLSGTSGSKKRGCWSWFQEREAINKQNQWKYPACDRSSQWSSPYCSDDNRIILDMNSERSSRKIWEWVMAVPTRQCSCSQCLEHPKIFGQK